jgi:YhcN/YlaJ family sporulation lipoprotein
VKKSVALSLSVLALFSALSAVGCTPAAQDRARTQNVPVHPAPPAPTPRTMTPTPTPAPAPAPATYRSAPEIARRVASVPGVSSASVLVSGRTAYVAVNTGTAGDRTHGRTTTVVPDRTVPPGTAPGTMGTPRTWDISDHLKQRISDVVKQTDPNITTVYVSANPAVFSRFEAFARDLASGRPVTSLGDLTDIIRRVWPTAR